MEIQYENDHILSLSAKKVIPGTMPTGPKPTAPNSISTTVKVIDQANISAQISVSPCQLISLLPPSPLLKRPTRLLEPLQEHFAVGRGPSPYLQK